MRIARIVAAAVLCTGLSTATPSRAGDKGGLDALLRALPGSRISLADGIRQAEKAGGSALSAKFEMDDGGHLSLSVYTAGKGLGVEAEGNILQELSGSPTGEKWAPATEVFKDVPHVARSSEQLALMALAPESLLSLVERMEKAEGGTVVSASPLLRGRKAILRGLTVKGGVVREWTADLLAGTFLPPKPEETTVRVAVKRHQSVREGAWVVEYGCAGIGDGNGFVYFLLKETPRTVEKVLVVNARGDTLVAPPPAKDKGGWYELNAGKEFGEPTELWIFPAAR